MIRLVFARASLSALAFLAPGRAGDLDGKLD
jgi:hypothetical protein